MERTVLRQIGELNRMSMAQLRKRWEDLFGSDGGHLSRNHLIRRLAYRVQELAYGGLSREARKAIKDIADGKSVGRVPKRQKTNLQPGTRLLRDWRGERYEVIVQKDAFLYDGKTYRSLSAVARAITGAHWSGNRFFGLTGKHKRQDRE